jgi:4-amino-4-deoxy-L-arabinose transferase-like glycosyltransferase
MSTQPVVSGVHSPQHLSVAQSEETPLRFWEIVAVIVVASVALLLKLGVHPLADWDEAIYAQISREIVQSHTWIPLSWNFQPWLEKPPFFMWTTALLFKCFGVSEFWARAASAFSGIALCVLLFAYAKRVANTRAAWLTVMALLTTVGFYDAARFGTTDVMLALGMYIGLIGLCCLEEGLRWGWYVTWIGLGVAVMTKGAAAAPLFLTIAYFAIGNRRRKENFNRQFFGGLLLFAAIVLPWHIYMWARYGTDFIVNYLGFQVIHRALTTLEGNYGGPRYYLLVIAERGTPWVFFLPLAFLRALRDRRLQTFAVFSLILLIFFTLIRTKLSWYIVPVYPALAIIVAFHLDDILREYPRFARLYPAAIAAVIGAFLVLSVHYIQGFDKVRGDVKLLLHDVPKGYSGPLLLCSDHENLPIPADLYYSQRKTIQTYFRVRPSDVPPADHHWLPVTDVITSGQDLAIIDRLSMAELPPSIRCKEIAETDGFVLALLSRKQ